MPHINKAPEPEEFMAPSVINPEISSRIHEESTRLYNISDQINEEINKLIRNYPSIVVRRKGVSGEQQKRQSKFPAYLSENQISCQKACSLEPSLVNGKARADIAHTIEYGKLI